MRSCRLVARSLNNGRQAMLALGLFCIAQESQGDALGFGISPRWG